jgi:hypothetical protein
MSICKPVRLLAPPLGRSHGSREARKTPYPSLGNGVMYHFTDAAQSTHQIGLNIAVFVCLFVLFSS